MKNYYVYMLRCSDGSLYTGITNNTERRVFEHSEGSDPSCYTFKRRPVKLVYSHAFTDVLQAISWEKTLKRWSRKKKEALIRGDQEALHKYAECINESHSRNKPSVSSRAETRDDTAR